MELAYSVDGTRFVGEVLDGSDGRRAPGILVAHEGPGLTEHTVEFARRLSELGTVALALDLYGERDLPLERAKEQVRSLRADRPALRRRMRAAWEALKGHPGVDPTRTAAIGFCFGGTAVLELARDGAELACVVGFHAGLDAADPADARAIRCPVLVCQGADDPIITAEKRAEFAAEMTAAGVDWRMLLLGGTGHSFTNPTIDAFGWEGFRYDPVADRRAWRALLDQLEEVFGPPAPTG